MKQIIPPNEFVISIIGKQKANISSLYRLFKYVKVIREKEEIILFNLITGGMISLHADELCSNDFDSLKYDDKFKLAIEDWFFVKQEKDDIEFCQRFESIVDAINSIYTNEKYLSYTILTTTDCNARCFYCYQSGCVHKSMSVKTAEDVANFILENSPKETKIDLRWFGGEPLFNSTAIDIITTILRKNNFNYSSTMTTNAYLFDDDLVFKAISDWKLTSVQITLDGTRKTYNKVKNYIYDDPNPFERVAHNIELLLINGITVKIRLNMDKHNIKDLFELGDYIIERYGNYNNINVYSHLLYENSCQAVKKHTKNDKVLLDMECRELNKKFSMFFGKEVKKKFNLKYRNHCMIDTDTAIMILPDGKIGKCEHYLDSNFIGDIYSGVTNFSIYNELKKRIQVCDKCKECMYRFNCRSEAYCPERIKFCDDSYKESVSKNIEIAVLEEYFKNK